MSNTENISIKIAPEDSFILVERGNKMSLAYKELDYLVEKFLKIAKKSPKWDKMPKGWQHAKSVKKYWKSLTEGKKHPFTECVKKMKGKMKKPEGFCAKTKDVAEGTTKWRGKERKKNKRK